MPNNMILLETIALTQSAASVTFDNLPTSGYTDLKIVMSVRTTVSGNPTDFASLRINGASTSISSRNLYGNGSSAASDSASAVDVLAVGDGATANTFSNAEVYITNYRSTTTYKSISIDAVNENNATLSYAGISAALYASNTAITSVGFVPYYGSPFAAGSTFSLYGVAAFGTTPVLAPQATGGNIVANDGTYWYHAFTSSGNFVPQVNLTADAIVIGAGGSAGGDVGGGAGAGRVYGLTSLTMANSTNYVCTVGAGAASPAGNAFGTKGTDSSLIGGVLSYTSLGGGGGNGRTGAAANNGWSGGGGSYNNATATAGNGGFSGGNTYQPNTNPCRCGGGGGSGAAASNATSGGGPGGNGTSTYSSWATATNTGVSGAYAGGGGGGQYGDTSLQAPGGSGGGGIGGHQSSNGGAGVANTGSGGGGAGSSCIGGAGGSGIVIIRYPIA